MSQSEGRNVKSVRWIAIDLIDLPEWDVRYTRDAEWERYFTEQIRRQGIRDPLHVLQRGSRYMLLEGFTRFKSARACGLKKVPCIVHGDLDVNPELYAFRLNMLRRSLGIVSVAWMANKMRFEWNWTMEQIAEELGCTRQHVYRLLKLVERDPEELREIELGLRPAWRKKRKKPHVSHDVTHGGKRASSGVRCPICGSFPEKGKGKWIYLCSEHEDAYDSLMEYAMSGEWKERERRRKPIREIRFVDE